jgi:hypothetical protein
VDVARRGLHDRVLVLLQYNGTSEHRQESGHDIDALAELGSEFIFRHCRRPRKYGGKL